MWTLALLPVALVVGYPLTILSGRPVAIMAGAAALTCVLGLVVRSTSTLTAGVAVAMGEYALALVLADSPPRLGGAVVIGVDALLLLEVARFEAHARHAWLGPGVAAAELRRWLGSATFAATASLALLAAGSALSTLVHLPWTPLLAAAGALAAVMAAVPLLLRRLSRDGA